MSSDKKVLYTAGGYSDESSIYGPGLSDSQDSYADKIAKIGDIYVRVILKNQCWDVEFLVPDTTDEVELFEFECPAEDPGAPTAQDFWDRLKREHKVG